MVNDVLMDTLLKYPAKTEAASGTGAAGQAESATFAQNLEGAIAGTQTGTGTEAPAVFDSPVATDEQTSTADTGMTNLFSALAGSDGNLEAILLMLCAMLSANSGSGMGEGGGEGMQIMMQSIIEAVTKKPDAEQEALRQTIMNSNYDTAVLDEVNDKVFKASGEQIPYEAWKPSNPPLTNTAENRNANEYAKVINQFDVENNGRYKVNKQGKGDTYCNIFVWDVTKAMGAEIPHYYKKTTGEPVSYENRKAENASEMTANAMMDWMLKDGEKYGWKQVSAAQAQMYANQGRPAVTVWKNENGKHGHVQVVRPSETPYDADKGVKIAQAGRLLYNETYSGKIYGKNTLKNVKYFVHV